MLQYLPIIVAVVGLLIWLLCKDKPAEAGRIAFFAGLLAALLNGVKHSF